MRLAKNAAVQVLRPRAASSSGSLHLAAPFCGTRGGPRRGSIVVRYAKRAGLEISSRLARHAWSCFPVKLSYRFSIDRY